MGSSLLIHMNACNSIEDHFPNVRKMVIVSKVTQRGSVVIRLNKPDVAARLVFNGFGLQFC